ncbi:unnamed protein product [Fusarium venenatum]|uniref:No apical meristem-associated C-terminal domain-containing protein n=1 Tax=Fusarium venenatum TaxID=56646 RepID=A0A2L2SYU9_9HYPO|nr:uncharacterized protein FVRRES_06495 [Fusarium venenatum]CEI62059.1 unnamed protein product [Fusarium venenatum]
MRLINSVTSDQERTKMEARVNQTKKESLEAGKKAQKTKDKAKSKFEKDDMTDENQAFQQWVVMNAHNVSEAMEWQKEKKRVYEERMRGDDQFEKVFIIFLHED